MGEPQFRADQRFDISLAQLSRDLAQIDLCLPLQVGHALVHAFAEYFETDRVNLLVYNASDFTIQQAVPYGTDLSAASWKVLGPVAQYAVTLKQPFFAYDVTTTPGIIPARREAYKTDAVAILPLINEGASRAVLCLSNLSTQQIMKLENSAAIFDFILSQTTQLTRYFMRKHVEDCQVKRHELQELEPINSYIARLTKHGGAEGAIAEFCRSLMLFAPLDAAFITYGIKNEQVQSVVYLNATLDDLELEKHFLGHAAEWRRRTRDVTRITLSEARILSATEMGQEAGTAEGCAEEVRNITLPLIIDGELFGLLGILSDGPEWDNQRTNQLANVFLYFLGMHLKKDLLINQNQAMKTVDSLTGLINEKRFYEMMEREFERSARYKVPLSILFVDVDHFKDVNETYGFEAGDYLLKEISMIIMENMRNTDFCSRYSGERFVVVLPDTHNANSEVMANRLRRYVENHSFQIPAANVFAKVSVSIGVSSFLEHAPSSLAQFIEFADTALYFAKRNGRNQVVNYTYVLDLMIGDTGKEGKD